MGYSDLVFNTKSTKEKIKNLFVLFVVNPKSDHVF